jgi:hypothetical protein
VVAAERALAVERAAAAKAARREYNVATMEADNGHGHAVHGPAPPPPPPVVDVGASERAGMRADVNALVTAGVPNNDVNNGGGVTSSAARPVVHHTDADTVAETAETVSVVVSNHTINSRPVAPESSITVATPPPEEAPPQQQPQLHPDTVAVSGQKRSVSDSRDKADISNMNDGQDGTGPPKNKNGSLSMDDNAKNSNANDDAKAQETPQDMETSTCPQPSPLNPEENAPSEQSVSDAGSSLDSEGGGKGGVLGVEKQALLLKARSNLRQALLAKKQALERAREASQSSLRPISALLKGGTDDLLLTDIRQSGPEDLVDFRTTTLLADDDSDDASHDHDSDMDTSQEEEDSSQGGGSNDKVEEEKEKEAQATITKFGKDAASEELRAKNDNAKSSLQQNITALKRKLALQTKIVEAKEKKQRLQLEQEKKENQEKERQENPVEMDDTETEATGPVTTTLSRQELEKRRDEATRHHSVTYFKHLISKQEHMLAEQQDKIGATKTALTECNDELEAEQSALCTSEQEDLRLTARGEVLDDMMAETTAKLIQARQRLHTYKMTNDKATVL